MTKSPKDLKMIILATLRKNERLGSYRILNNTIETNSKSLTRLTILEVATKIKLIDFEAAKKWLDKKKITIYKETKFCFVYEIDVDVAMDKPRIIDLRNQFPNNWKEIYQKMAKDNSVYEMVVLSLDGELRPNLFTKINPKDADEQALINRYSA